MSAAKIDAGYRKLAIAAAAAGGLSADARNWLVRVLDPFHDIATPLRGLPDQCQQKTVVQEVKKVMTVDQSTFGPGAFEAGRNWDLRIDLHSFLQRTRFTGGLYNILVQNCINTKQSPQPFGVSSAEVFPLAVTALQNGATLYPDDSVNIAIDSLNYFGLSTETFALNLRTRVHRGLELGRQFSAGQPIRVIAAGFESQNTTADLYLQGGAVYYRATDPFQHGRGTSVAYGYTDPGGNFSHYLSFDNVIHTTLPPPRLDTMLLLPGTIQNLAREGSYTTSCLNYDRIKMFLTTGQSFPVMYQNSFGTVGVTNPGSDEATLPIWSQSDCWSPDPGQPRRITNVMLSSITPAGVYYTSLSPQSSFQVNVKWVLEVIPPFDNQLIVAATQSAFYEQEALEIYAKTCLIMPVGCTFAENPLGEWFDSVMGILSKVAPVVGGAIGGPAGMMIGGLASQVFSGVGAYNASLRDK